MKNVNLISPFLLLLEIGFMLLQKERRVGRSPRSFKKTPLKIESSYILY